MSLFNKYMDTLGFVNKNIEEDPNAPKYIKPDGTRVYEQNFPEGTLVYEIKPDKTFISRAYNISGEMYMDYIRKGNFELGHYYDECGLKVYEYDAAYDNNNNLVVKNEKVYAYYENNQIASEFYFKLPENIKIQTTFDETGKKTGKIEIKGSVKIYYDENNKPYKREIDRGSGGIITENIE